MSTLVVHLPERERLHTGSASATTRAAAEFAFVLSVDGQAASRRGRCAPALLPKADLVVAVLPDGDVSWHRTVLPKAPAARLRAALVGVLEEALLDEAEVMHLALAPGAVPGASVWVAAVHKSWLAAQLAALEQAGVPVDRVVPSSWPEEQPAGHFADIAGAPAGSAAMSLTLSDASGAATLRLLGGLSRALLPQWHARATRWTATPAVAAPAERWLDARVQVQDETQRALQAARSLWNLRQFDLAPRRRGSLALRELGRRLRSPAWRPARWGLVSLVALHVLGLNLWAWHQQGLIASKRRDMAELLRSTHPQVRAVLDAPIQMQREAEILRAQAGRAGDNDLETLLHAAAAAWPDGQPPIEGLRFESGRLTVPATGWSAAQMAQFSDRLRLTGWAAEFSNGTLTLERGAAAAGTS